MTGRNRRDERGRLLLHDVIACQRALELRTLRRIGLSQTHWIIGSPFRPGHQLPVAIKLSVFLDCIRR